MANRPKDEEELQRREAAGIIRASRFVRAYSRSRRPININTVCEIHKCIFQEAWPEIAGVCRDENIKITDSKHLPPHFSQVQDLMAVADNKLKVLQTDLDSAEGILLESHVLTNAQMVGIDRIVHLAAWLHHTVTFIHPFREGNGRTARLAANLILERYGLVGISIKMERENKNRYRETLSQIDSAQDYEPLKGLIYEGLIDRYNGLSMKYLK